MKTPYELYLEDPHAFHLAARRERSIALWNLLRKLFAARPPKARLPARVAPRHA